MLLSLLSSWWVRPWSSSADRSNGCVPFRTRRAPRTTVADTHRIRRIRSLGSTKRRPCSLATGSRFRMDLAWYSWWLRSLWSSTRRKARAWWGTSALGNSFRVAHRRFRKARSEACTGKGRLTKAQGNQRQRATSRRLGRRCTGTCHRKAAMGCPGNRCRASIPANTHFRTRALGKSSFPCTRGKSGTNREAGD